MAVRRPFTELTFIGSPVPVGLGTSTVPPKPPPRNNPLKLVPPVASRSRIPPPELALLPLVNPPLWALPDP